MWWGNVGDAELDLVLDFPGGMAPVVWVSCKRQHQSQKRSAFLLHINRLQVGLLAGMGGLGNASIRLH